MAISRPNVVRHVKDRIYNSGLGEKPSIRRAAVGSTTDNGDGTVSFDMATGEGAFLRPGHILSKFNSTDADDAYAWYVLSVSTDTVLAVDGWNAPAIGGPVTMPVLLEHQPLATESMIQDAIDAIVAEHLWPEIYDIFVDSFTPNFASLQSDANAGDEEIIRAWQKIGPTLYQVPAKLVHNMPTSEFPSGAMIIYDVRVGTDVNYSVKRKISFLNSTNTALETLIAKGAAAIVLEGIEETTEDEKPPRSITQWQAFTMAKREFEKTLAKEAVTAWKVDRG